MGTWGGAAQTPLYNPVISCLPMAPVAAWILQSSRPRKVSLGPGRPMRSPDNIVGYSLSGCVLPTPRLGGALLSNPPIPPLPALPICASQGLWLSLFKW